MSRRSRSRRKLEQVSMGLADTLQINPQFSMLNREDCGRLHQASLAVLVNTGVEVQNEAALRLLQQADTSIDGNRVKMKPALVE